MNTSLNSFDPSVLPSEIRAVFLVERTARQVAEERAEKLAEQNLRLEHLLREFRRALHGKKSEKLSVDQLALAFEDLETALGEAESEGEAAKDQSSGSQDGSAAGPAKAAAKRNLGHLPEEFPRIERIIEPDSIECPCGCGEMARIGEDRSERLDIIPAKFQVIVTIRPKYACRACQDKVLQEAAPAHLIESGLPSEGLIAHILVAKYADHLPLYRQAQIYARSGLDLHRSTLANWVGKAAFHLRPIVEAMAKDLKSSNNLFMDETTAPVLDPGRGKTKTGYLWALARDERGWGGTDPPGVIFHYAPGRSGKYGEDFLDGFDGTLQVDAYAGYKRLTRTSRKGGAPLVLAKCWSHARRKLFDLTDRGGPTGGGSEIANDGLRQIAELYRIEAEIRGQSPARRLAVRQARAVPIVAKFEIWLEQQRARVSAKSRLGEKLTYIANHWAGLQVYLSDGRVEIDSNLVENTIRPIALNRKNALFAGHDEGGKNWGLIASLIETCKINGVNPFDYLKATLEALANGHPQSRINELMPWAFNNPSS